MLHKKIIKRIPGHIPETSPREKQGYIEDLRLKTKGEIQELLGRQNKLLANKNFIGKLPDKGAKISQFQFRLAEELAQKDEIEKTCGLLSDLSIGKSSVSDEIEWTGKFSEDVRKPQMLDSDDESDEEINPLKILATQSGVGTYKKLHKIEAPEPNLIKPEDLKDTNFSVPKGLVENGPQDYVYVKHLCDMFEKPREKKKEPFRPFRTLKADGQSGSSQQNKTPLGSHWEVTAATPPPPVHGDVKLINLQESLQLQKEQAAKLKEIQVKHAAKKLASQLGVKIGNILPDPSLQSAYRDERQHTDSSSGSENEMDNSEGEIEDEEPEKGSAVAYNIVD